MELSDEQRVALGAVLNGENTFITGPAGTGKSFILGEILDQLEAQGKRVALVAPTGVAAINIGGRTLHSFAGIKLGKDPAVKYAVSHLRDVSGMLFPGSAAADAVKPAERFLIDTLIMDEVSMCSAELLRKVDIIAREMRRRAAHPFDEDYDNEAAMVKRVRENEGRPFGGMQIVVIGDFFQLPPVDKRETNDGRGELPLCWICGGDCVSGDDSDMDAAPLNCTVCGNAWAPNVRFAFEADPSGYPLWDECNFTFCELTKVFRQKGDIKFINMLHRVRVGRQTEEDNMTLAKLDRPLPKDDGVIPTKLSTHNRSVDQENERNYRRLDKGTEHVYDAKDQSARSKMGQYLMRTIESRCKWDAKVRIREGAQVMLLHNTNVDLGLCNGTRGVVTGFKRVELDELDLRPGVKPEYDIRKEYPVVRFFTPSGPLEMVVAPVTMNITDSRKRAWASRTQVPLKHAWAITIHKSQGMTLSKMEADVANSFETGQTYVALSRAQSMDGLRVLGYRPDCVKTNQQVLQFYDMCRKASVLALAKK